MISRFREFVRKNALFSPGDHILLAVSGGMDSVFMTFLFHGAGIKFGIAHCNFGLRGADSDEDERFVEQLAGKLQVSFFSRKFSTMAVAKRDKISIQMAARELRYNWFEELRAKEGYDFIATAHHLDDQIETLFINLLRGTGLSGLHGIMARQGRVIRPILFVYRHEIENHITGNHIPFRSDHSNLSTKYIRNRIRLELIPLLTSINKDFREIMTDNIRRFRDSEEVYKKEIDRARKDIVRKSKNKVFINTKKLLKHEPPSVYLHEILADYGFNESMIHDLLKSLGHSESRIFGSADWSVLKERDEIVVARRSDSKEQDSGEEFFLNKGQKIQNEPFKLKIAELVHKPGVSIPAGREVASLDLGKLEFPLLLRRWKPGDSFYPFGMRGRKKVSDYLTDTKVRKAEKAETWVLWSGKKIAWVVGYRIDNRFRITAKTKNVLRISCMGNS